MFILAQYFIYRWPVAIIDMKPNIPEDSNPSVGNIKVKLSCLADSETSFQEQVAEDLYEHVSMEPGEAQPLGDVQPSVAGQTPLFLRSSSVK
jgi:hypothetical protein